MNNSGVKAVSLFCCYILVSAMFLWGSGFVSADEEDEITKLDIDHTFQRVDLDVMLSELGRGVDESDIQLRIDKGGFFTFVGGKLDGLSLNTEILDTLSKDSFVQFINENNWEDGKLTLDVKGGKRTIDFKNMPDTVKSVSISDTGKVEYELEKPTAPFVESGPAGTSRLFISDNDVFVSKGDTPGSIVFGGIKKDGKKVSVNIISNPEEVTSERTIEYDPKTGINVKVHGKTEHEYQITEFKDGMSFETLEDGMYVLKGGKVKDVHNKITIEANKEGILFGEESSETAGFALEYEGTHIKLDKDGKISGDLSKLEGETLSITNDGNTQVSVSKGLVTGSQNADFSIGSSKTGEFFVKDGKVHLRTSKEGSSSKDTSKSTDTPDSAKSEEKEKPSLPAADGDNTIKAGDPNAGSNPGSGGFPDGNCGPGLDGGCNPGLGGGIPAPAGQSQTSLQKMLPWLLIIGGGALAAMFLFGGDDEEEKEDSNRRDGVKGDGGTPYYDPASELNDEYEEPGEVGTPIVTYNANEPDRSGSNSNNDDANVQCECNASGCFKCPDGNCYACTPTQKKPSQPTIQTIGNSSGNSEDN